MQNAVEYEIPHNLAQFVTQEDINTVYDHMDMLRRTGIVPSKVVERGLNFADEWIRETKKQLGTATQLRVSACAWENAAIKLGVHAGTRRKMKEE